MKDDGNVAFEILSEEMIPQKVQEILPRYKALERALACKVDGDIYVIATRGEKPTGGFTVDIDRIMKVKEEDKNKLVIYVTFEDPKPGDVVTQVITYPYTVAKTNLKELPDKIELKVKYDE
ncbi:MAG: protease complex subunit PrcB family protein [Geosporobacter ferrireducens]|nr:protease complex subunit PrcB family protein [Geosporobacter ferrireducens]